MHDPTTPAIIEAPLLQELAEDGPVQAIICLIEIKLKEHALLTLHLYLVDNLMKCQDAIMNMSPFKEGELIRMCELFHHRGKPRCTCLGGDPLDGNDHCARSKCWISATPTSLGISATTPS